MLCLQPRISKVFLTVSPNNFGNKIPFLGNVKEIIANATAAQDEYMFHFDLLSQYMFRLNVPKETVDRVKDWCRHTWKTQKSFDELALLGKYTE